MCVTVCVCVHMRVCVCVHVSVHVCMRVCVCVAPLVLIVDISIQTNCVLLIQVILLRVL